jgi:hypothetical protein
VEVRDDGHAKVAPRIPDALPSASAGGGRGLYLVKRLVDQVELGVGTGGHGVTVRMTSNLQPAADQSSDTLRTSGTAAAPRGTVEGAAATVEQPPGAGLDLPAAEKETH